MLNQKGLIRKSIVRPLIRRVVQRLLNVVDVPIRFANVEMSARMSTVGQLRQLCPSLSADKDSKPPISTYEAKVFSQHGEDGIFAYIFSQIGLTNRRFIEFGIEDGTECNTANLSINFGWNGLLIEGSQAYVESAQRHYARMLRDKRERVKIVHGFITAENVNDLFEKHGVTGEIDLLSIDIDGSDYWVWNAITTISPRVICAEYNSTFGPDRSVAVKYDPAFERFKKHESGFYYGASLAALTNLANTKGYILIGCESQGVNAFFVRKDVAKDRFEAISPAAAYIPQYSRIVHMSTEDQYRLIERLPLEEV